MAAPSTLTMRVCRKCGCDDLHACRHGDGTPCHWVELDLCSACAVSSPAVRCSHCRLMIPAADIFWPGEVGKPLCQTCWEKTCDEAWWSMVQDLGGLYL